MFKKMRNIAVRNLINIPGWRTDRKIVVIESDDWGMVRMASKESYDWFLKNGYRVDLCPYNRNDAIESNQDLELLFEVLTSVTDRNGNPAIFTANNVVANPDFAKIKKSGFRNYYYEPFPETLKRYPGRDRVIDLYREGIARNFFRPQFHGREHLNVNRWMQGIASGDTTLRDAFKQNMVTVHESGRTSGRRHNLDAFGLGNNENWVNLEDVIESGLNLFEDLWGYRSLSFIAPCYTWPKKIESVLAANGVKYIQGNHVQRVPIRDDKSKIQRKYHYMGQKNSFGQRYLIRNVRFEPLEDGDTEIIDMAMKQIKTAFGYRKPAIIGSHRVNYMGSIRPENREKNLKLLGRLLNKIVERYPEVEFMSSDRLGNLITQEN